MTKEEILFRSFKNIVIDDYQVSFKAGDVSYIVAKDRSAFDGKTSFSGKISKDILVEIKKMIADNIPNKVIASMFNIDPSNVSKIKHNHWRGLKYV